VNLHRLLFIYLYIIIKYLFIYLKPMHWHYPIRQLTS